MAKSLPSIFRKRGNSPESRFQGEHWLYSAPSAAGTRITPETSLSISAYFAAINCIASDTACLPLNVFERAGNGDKTRLNDHPLHNLLMVSPDGETTSIKMRAALMGHTLGWGNGYAEIVRKGNGDASSIHLLDPSRTKAERLPSGELVYNLGDGRALPKENVIHIAGFGFDGLTGYTPCDILRTPLGIAAAADQFSAAYFKNASNPKGYLKFKSPSPFKDEAEAERFRSNWDKNHAGVGNAGRTAILTGDTDFIQLSVKPEDAQLLATRQFSVLEIARPFRLPPHKLGDYSNSHYNNIEAANLDYLVTSLMFWLTTIEKELTFKLFKISEPNHFVEHNVDAFLRGSVEARTNHLKTMFENGVINRNEWRRLENMNSLGPDGNQYYVTKQIGNTNDES